MEKPNKKTIAVFLISIYVGISIIIVKVKQTVFQIDHLNDSVSSLEDQVDGQKSEIADIRSDVDDLNSKNP